jgi:hypothetical protein
MNVHVSTLYVYVVPFIHGKGAKGLSYTIKHIVSGRSAGSWLDQLTDDLKAPPKASVLFFEPSVSFDTISYQRKGSQSLVIWLYKSKLEASLPSS